MLFDGVKHCSCHFEKKTLAVVLENTGLQYSVKNISYLCTEINSIKRGWSVSPQVSVATGRGVNKHKSWLEARACHSVCGSIS